MKEQKFDWHKAPLTPDTKITDSYKNTQNARRFFKEQIGKNFHFTVEFMVWMKNNCGRALWDAVQEWKRQNEKNK